MTQKRTLLSALYQQDSIFDTMFTDVFFGAYGFEKIENPGQRVMVLWGGEDISPSIYGQRVGKAQATDQLSRRDLLEVNLVKWAIDEKIPIIGICRGAQMLCALSGGKLVQHVNNHFGDHPIFCSEFRPGLGNVTLRTSSIHHQMMIPDGIPHTLLAWSNPKISKTYLNEDNEEIESCHEHNWKEPEIVWFPETKFLCIQGHPEYMSKSHPFVKYCADLVEALMFSEEPTQPTNV